MTEAFDMLIREWKPDDVHHDFNVKLRVHSCWDEAHYLRIMQAARACIASIQTGEHPTKTIVHILTDGFSYMAGQTRHPGFQDLSRPDEVSVVAHNRMLVERVMQMRATAAEFIWLIQTRYGLSVFGELPENWSP